MRWKKVAVSRVELSHIDTCLNISKMQVRTCIFKTGRGLKRQKGLGCFYIKDAEPCRAGGGSAFGLILLMFKMARLGDHLPAIWRGSAAKLQSCKAKEAGVSFWGVRVSERNIHRSPILIISHCITTAEWSGEKKEEKKP